MKKVMFFCSVLEIRYEWFMSILNLWEILHRRRDINFHFYSSYRKPIHIGDTLMVREALKENYDYILRIDDDVWDVPENAFDLLFSADKDMISAVMYAHGFPFQQCAMRKSDPTKRLEEISKGNAGGLKEVTGSGVQPCDLVAMPFTLFKTDLFRKIPEPWFVNDETVPPDSYFCQKMLDHGLQPYAHMDIKVTHRGITAHNRMLRFIEGARERVALGLLKPEDNNYKVLQELVANIHEIVKFEET